MLDFEIILREDNRSFRDKVLNAMVDKINGAIKRNHQRLTDSLRDTLGNIYRQTQTYQSLVDGRLAGHFGFFAGNGIKKAEAIVRALQNSLFINYRPIVVRAGYLDGGLTVKAIKSDLSDVLNLTEAEIVTPENGYILPWLEWLLLEGDRIIISDFSFEPRLGSGRSLKGIMIKSNRPWRVPPEYSGTIRNNWLTRTIEADKTFLEDSFADTIDRHIDRHTR